MGLCAFIEVSVFIILQDYGVNMTVFTLTQCLIKIINFFKGVNFKKRHSIIKIRLHK